MISDYTPIKIEEFNGQFNRGPLATVPPDHARSVLNIRFGPKSGRTRDGVDFRLAMPGIVERFHPITIDNTDRFLVLINQSIYDSFNTAVPILTLSGMTDFSCITINNKVYITRHNRTQGIGSVYVYDGSTVRLAAGYPPLNGSPVFTAAESSTNGNINAGTHQYAIVYVTNTGFITKPGPRGAADVFQPASASANGAKSVDLTNIPVLSVGGAHIVAKRVLATKANLGEFFFVPGAAGELAAGQTIKTLNYTDAQLVDSADYLFDMVSEIPAGLGFCEFANRLVLYGFGTPNASLLRVSEQGVADEFSLVDGVVIAGPNSVGNVTNCFEQNNVLYIVRSIEYPGMYSIIDNGLNPAEWGEPTLVDGTVNTTVFGVSQVLNESKQTTEGTLIATRSGLTLFNGSVVIPELTWKIEQDWLNIGSLGFPFLQVAIDPQKSLIYVSASIFPSTIPNKLYVGDYTQGLSAGNIKWAIWDWANIGAVPRSMGVYRHGPLYRLHFGDASMIFVQVDNKVQDGGVNVVSGIQFGQVAPDDGFGSVNFFGPIRMKIRGSGIIQTSLLGLDESSFANYANITLSGSFREILERTIFQDEVASLVINMPAGGWMEFSKFELFSKVLWPVRPR